jgi:hypothetical protein
MALPTSQCLFVLLVTVVTASLAASASNQSPKATLAGCIDDSDCTRVMGQGKKYACFQYICYPWKDDSSVPENERKELCRKKADCDPSEYCHRHHDRRNVYKGLCLDKTECDGNQDCKSGKGCCAGRCCEMKFYKELNELPCASSQQCQDLSLGDFCCPRKNDTDICCDEDPNPTTPPPPSKATSSGHQVASAAIVVVALQAAVRNF